MDEPPSHLFLSYASADRDRAFQVAAALRAEGVRVWIDRSEIAGGTGWAETIATAVRTCSALAVLCSAQSVQSRNVRQELQLAWDHARPILPLLLEPLTFPDGVAYFLQGTQWLQIHDRSPDAWLPEIVAAVRRFGSPPIDATPTHQAANRLAATGKLPALAHPLIGREDDVAQLVTAIRDDQARLLTLTGPGGVGKTSLALAVGAALQSVFGDGVWFVDLAPLTDPGLVLAAIGTVLGVQEEAGRTLRETLGDLLRRRHLMLVLDNMEHVLDAATEISDLLANAAGLTILATSRIPLHLSAEREYAVEPLATGPADARMGSEATDSPAVRLFVERAQTARPGFRLTGENSGTVAAICARLDGLPLAIELAAARIKMLSPEALLQRLDQRLPILTGGARDHRERQRTLRDTIAWSYDLLSQDERTLFRQLAVFAGGFTLEAAEAVTNPEGTFDSFELLGSLVDKNLVRSDDVAGEPRFRMLETVREFAAIAFAESTDHLEIRKHHLDYFTKFAEVAADPTLSYQDQLDGLDRLDAERDNLRSAVAFAIEAGDAEIALQMATMIAGYLRERGEVSEAREWLECALELEPAPVDRRLAALNWAGFLARFQGDVERATYLANTGHAEALAAGNRREEAEALRLLGMIFGGSGDEERGEALLEEALEVFRTIGDKRGVATALSNLGAGMSGRDPERAAQLLRESIALDRELGDRVPNDWVLATLAEIELLLENLERAEELVLEALTTQRQYDLRAGLCWSLQVLGWTRLAQDDPHSAGDAFEEALNVTRETGQNSYLTTLFVGRGRVDLRLGRTTEAAEQFGRALSQIQEHGLSAFWPEEELVLILRDLAEMRLAQGQPDTAARLLGAAQALPQIGIAAMTSESKSREELTDRARSMLDDDVFAREHSAGLGMTPEEILAEAVAQAAAIATGRGKSGTGNRVYDRSM